MSFREDMSLFDFFFKKQNHANSPKGSRSTDASAPDISEAYKNDPDFQKYSGKVNEFNASLFAIASTFQGIAKLNAYEIASHVEDNEFRDKVKKFFESYNNRRHHLLSNELFYKYDVEHINKYNFNFYIEAHKIEDIDMHITACKLAKYVTDIKSQKKVRSIFDALKNGSLSPYCFTDDLLRMEFIQPAETDVDNIISHSNTEDKVFENLYNKAVMYDREIDINDPTTYEKISNGTLCYQGNNLYIKKENGLSKLNLSKKDFDKLFPGNSLLTFSQKFYGDCYLLTSFYALLNSVEGRERILNCFSIEKNGNIIVKFPYREPIIYEKKDIANVRNDDRAVDGSLGIKLLEDAFFKRRSKSYITHKNEANSKNEDDKYLKLKGGNAIEIFHLFGFYETQGNEEQEQNNLKSTSILERFNEYFAQHKNENPIICLGTHTKNPMKK